MEQHRVALALIIALLVIFGSFALLATTVHGETQTENWSYLELQLNPVTYDYVDYFLIYNSTHPDNPNTKIDGNKIYIGPDINFPNDIRFCYDKDPYNAVLPQYIAHDIVDNGTVFSKTSVLVYVKIPANLDTLYLFYNNSDAIAYSNGSAVFTFFDDFDRDYLGNYTQESGSSCHAVEQDALYFSAPSGHIYTDQIGSTKEFYANRTLFLTAKVKISANMVGTEYFYIGVENYSNQALSDFGVSYSDSGAHSKITYPTPAGTTTVSSSWVDGEFYIIYRLTPTTVKCELVHSDDKGNLTVFKTFSKEDMMSIEQKIHLYAKIYSSNSGSITVWIDYAAFSTLDITQTNVTTISNPEHYKIVIDTGDPDTGGTDTGGTGDVDTNTSSSDILENIKDFATHHPLTVVFAALALLSLILRNGKAFILFGLLAVASYYMLASLPVLGGG